MSSPVDQVIALFSRYWLSRLKEGYRPCSACGGDAMYFSARVDERDCFLDVTFLCGSCVSQSETACA